MNVPNAKSKEYKAWQSMIRRVTNKEYKYYERYSKLGIDHRWLTSFKSFYEYIGDAPRDGNKWSLGRIENSIGYYEGNIRWETCCQQNRNRFMTIANSSGATGVAVRVHRNKGMRAVARWYDVDGKSRSKSFCESVYGTEYFNLACQYRIAMIESLTLSGSEYAHNHGDVFDTKKLLTTLQIEL